jgi:FMN phosphatase YigB (HAD superfamily)
MLSYHDFPSHKTVFIFELDQVLVPQKDYDLQVYYLFANFIEYLETFPLATDVTTFIQNRYEAQGNTNIFSEVSQAFGIDKKYQENLELLYINAKLPLKLLLYEEALKLLQELVVNRKHVFILTAGNPLQQLNKITQTEWNGLDKYLKVYFKEELAVQFPYLGLSFILEENKLVKDDVIMISNLESDKLLATDFGIDFIYLT